MKYLLISSMLLFLGCGHRITPEEQLELEIIHEKVKQGVSDWIIKYAKYPDSYEPISWQGFSRSIKQSNNNPIPNTENYFIKHTHKLLDKDSVLQEFSGYFILEYDFDVNIIEIEKSNSSGGAFPPITAVWTDQFGRLLNAQDSLEFDLKRNEKTKRFIKEMKDGLENGDLEFNGPEGLDSLRELIDTLEKRN